MIIVFKYKIPLKTRSFVFSGILSLNKYVYKKERVFAIMLKIVGTQGWLAHSSSEGGEAMSVFEALMFAIAFATLVIAILSFNHKK